MDVPVIEGFKIIEKLGEGGMASVWKANQISVDRLVAIKILSPDLSTTTENVERFQKEAKVAAKLKHSGIVQVYDAKISNGLYCFIMEYISGYTVGDWIRRKGHIGEVDTLTVADCMAEAMDYAWSASRLVHCDIKPDNIMIDADGTVKVADLGLAYTINAIRHGEKSDVVLGTPAYISPEQAEGRLDLDCRSDIYSLGAMMYHMLTGKLMFYGNPDDKVMEMQVYAKPEDAQKLNPSIPNVVNNLLKKLLQKNRDKRPEDWKAVRKLLLDVRCRLTGNAEQGGSVTVLAALTGNRKSAKKKESHNVPDKSSKGTLIIAGSIMLVLIIFFALFISGKRDKKIQKPRAGNSNKVISSQADRAKSIVNDGNVSNVVVVENNTNKVTPDISAEETARKMFEYAASRNYDTIQKMQNATNIFSKVAEETAGTKYSLMAEDKVKYYKAVINAKITEVERTLDDKAKPFIKDKDFPAAADVYDSYQGALWQETAEYRKSKAKQLINTHESILKKKQLAIQKQKEHFNKFYQNIPKVLLNDGVDAAVDFVAAGMKNPEFKNYKKELMSVYAVLKDTQNIDDRIMNSFKEQIGQEIVINTIYGPKKLLILNVDKTGISVRRNIKVDSGVVSSDIKLKFNEISQREKLNRMGDESEMPVLLAKGLMAIDVGAYDYAMQFFGKLDKPFSIWLTKELNKRIEQETNVNACSALRDILLAIGVEVPADFNIRIWNRLLTGLIIESDDIDKINKMIDTYIVKYGSCNFTEKAMPVIAKLEKVLNISKVEAERERTLQSGRKLYSVRGVRHQN